jgi:hypothetical protein
MWVAAAEPLRIFTMTVFRFRHSHVDEEGKKTDKSCQGNRAVEYAISDDILKI